MVAITASQVKAGNEPASGEAGLFVRETSAYERLDGLETVVARSSLLAGLDLAR